MSNSDDTQPEDEFYFEDDRDLEDYPGCGMSIPPVPDPISLLNPDRLRVHYGGQWPRYDRLQVTSQRDEFRPAIALINDVRVPIHRRTDLYEYANSLSDLPKHRDLPLAFHAADCPYCKTPVAYHQIVNGISGWDDDDDIVEEMDEFADIKALEYCRKCRYWRWHDMEVRTSFDSVQHRYSGYLSKIREFDARLPDGFVQEVAQWIRRDERRWHIIAPTSLEKLVADVMKSVYRHSEVLHVGRPDDGGVDVVLIETDGKKWLIQVKGRQKAYSTEPVETVRNLLGAMFLEDASYGMVVSTADHFTQRAYEVAKRAHEKGSTLRLVDRTKLSRMLDSVLPEKPWMELLAKEYPQLVGEFEAAVVGKS